MTSSANSLTSPAVRVVHPKPWKIQHVLQQVLQGIAFLHQNKIIHRDIKLTNVLMRSETQPVISDFELSRDINSLAHTTHTHTSLAAGRKRSREEKNTQSFIHL
jgi:serine/threonine protein kinase